MICDHVGYYLHPGDMTYRIIGRLCVPIWFFLIGYAKSRDLGWKIWGGLAVMQLANMFAGLSFFPMDILATMIFLRLVIDRVMKGALTSYSTLWAIVTMIVLLIEPSWAAFEYGTLSLPLAMFGYLVRNKENLKEPQKIILQFFAFTYILFVGTQTLVFQLHDLQVMALAVGSFIVMSTLMIFQAVSFPRLTEILPRPVVLFLQFTGRHTMLIYVVHLLIFKGTAPFLHPERFHLFKIILYSATGT
jgi:hypothetical protein